MDSSRPEVSSERLLALVDESDIRAILVRFARYLDERNWDAYAALYAENGVLVLPHGEHRGRAGLAEWVGSDLGQYLATQHIAANHDILVDGDTATARTSLFGVHVTSDDGRSLWAGGGHYGTELERRPEGWRLTHVRAQPAWLFDTGGAFPHG